MATTEKTGVPVTLGGKERAFVYDVNSWAELEGVLGKPFRQILKQMRAGLTGVREIRALVWAGLIHAEPNLTLRDVGQMLTADNIERVAQLAMQAVALPSDAAPGRAART